MARFALAAHERHGTHAVPHVIRSRRKKLLLAGLRALGPHMIGDTPVTLGERGPHLIGGRARRAGMADGHVCRELRQQINELARAPLPHLREDPTDCRTHLLQVALGPLSPGILRFTRMMRRSSGSMSRVINPFFSRAASTVEMRPELAFSELASCDGVMVPRSASSCRMNGSPCAPRANSFCILERLPHTLAYSSLSASRSKPISHRLPIRPLPHYRAPRSTANTFQRHIHRANICNIISHRKQFTVCDYMSAPYSPATNLICTHFFRTTILWRH